MLDALGLDETADLFADIPAEHRFPELDLPEPLSELEARGGAAELAHRNGRTHNAGELLSFAGAGAYDHFIPSVVSYLAGRGEFTTAYTPYQAEASQGTLQTIFEYQSMMADLLEMDVVNASHYDGATALAEAAIMAVRSCRGRSRVVTAGGVHPEYREVAATYLRPQGIELVVVDSPETPGTYGPAHDDLVAALDGNTAALIVQNPDFFGRLADLAGLADAVHETGALLVIHTDPIAAALFRTAGSVGADIVTGEGQPLGIPVSYGGPYLGLFAARQALVRKIPGRLVGQTTDAAGERGFVLTLNTREQHIRREKATSNICTNQGLMALRAAIYLASLGPHGLREVATLCYHKARYAASRLAGVPGCAVFPAGPAAGNPGPAPGTSGPAPGTPGPAPGTPGHAAGNPGRAPATPGPAFFREFVLQTPVPAEALVERAAAAGVVPGVPLSRYYPQRTHELLVAVTETASRERIDRLVSVVAECRKGGSDE
jgi:glycine dehydrogenase subunit 1